MVLVERNMMIKKKKINQPTMSITLWDYLKTPVKTEFNQWKSKLSRFIILIVKMYKRPINRRNKHSIIKLKQS